MDKQKPKSTDFYYEFSLGKHCYKFQRPDIGYVCVTDDDKDKALQKMFDEINTRQLNAVSE